MRTRMLFILIVLPIAACSQHAFRQATYEAAYQKGCMDQEGRPNCDPAHPDYDSYQRERATLHERSEAGGG